MRIVNIPSERESKGGVFIVKLVIAGLLLTSFSFLISLMEILLGKNYECDLQPVLGVRGRLVNLFFD